MFELILLAQLIDCAPNHPGGDTRPKGWAWRTIVDADGRGRQCWYEGQPMLPKDRLRWPPPAELPPPEWLQEPPAPPPLTEFELRWRGATEK